MTDLLAVVRSADEALAASEAGADVIAIAVPPGSIEAPERPLLRCGPMLTATQPDAVRAVADTAAAGLKRLWLPLEPDGRPAIEAAVARDLTPIIRVPLGHPLDDALCETINAAGAAELLVAGPPFGADRMLDVYSIATLGAFLSSAGRQGLRVGFAGSLEAPDVPRLLALGPASLGLDTLLRDELDRFSPDRLRAARTLWTEPAPAAVPQQPEPDRIFVRDWTVLMNIGAYASERDAPQRVRFSVEVDLAPISAAIAGLAGIVSYDLVTDRIARLVSEHVEFVETAAETIAASLLAHPRVLTVSVAVEKLDRGPGSVGCRIVRRRRV